MKTPGFPLAAVLAGLVAVAAGCGGEKAETKALPPAISLGAPPGPGPGGGGMGGEMPPGHPPVGAGGSTEGGAKPPVVPDRFRAPEGWQAETPTSNMRVAQFRIPRADGDSRDGEVVVFGGPMGSTTSNIDRWRSQFTEVVQGKDALEEIAAGEKGKITLLDITGNYAGGMGAGTEAAAAHAGAAEGSTRMIGAVIEAGDKVFYVKATAPPGTMGKWETSVREFIKAAAK